MSLSNRDLLRIEKLVDSLLDKRELKFRDENIPKIKEEVVKGCNASIIFNNEQKIEEYRTTIRRVNTIYKVIFAFSGIFITSIAAIGGKIGYDFIEKYWKYKQH